jgi:hypothetical protein
MTATHERKLLVARLVVVRAGKRVRTVVLFGVFWAV